MTIKRETYYRVPLPSALKVGAIYTVHYFRYGKNFTYPLESHPFWELVFIDGGEALVTADGERMTLTQGEIRFHAPDVVHTIETKDEFSNSVIVSFEASGRIMAFLENKTFKLNQREKTLLRLILSEAKSSFEGRLDDPNQTKMTQKENSPFGSSQMIKNLLEILLLSVVRDNLKSGAVAGTESAPANVHADRIVESILKILKERVTASVTLDELADELYFSKTYIKAVFKKSTGISIIRYYNGLKIDEAKRLISTNKHTFTEISDMLGFSSVHYFSRIFKQYTDMTPMEYSKSIKEDNLLR